MNGLKSFSNWRTFVTGMLVGYIFAWGIHWAAQFSTIDGHWYDEVVPFLTPQFGRRIK